MLKITNLLAHLTFAVAANFVLSACMTTAGDHDGADKSATLSSTETGVLRLNAEGTQNYVCQAMQNVPDNYAWVFVAPEAKLFDTRKNLVGKHYAGPTWESLIDRSKVVGIVKASAPSPDANAIPWLLLSAMPSGDRGMFSQVKSIQRLDTYGGEPPVDGCSQATVNRVLKVPYHAKYYFSE